MSAGSIASREGELWNRPELMLALELYCTIPFQKTKASNPQVQQLAAIIGRTPASVARKLGNFGAFDPHLQQQNILGLRHTGKLDKETWDEFSGKWGKLVTEAQRVRSDLYRIDSIPAYVQLQKGPSERVRLTKQRLHQDFFRSAVLSSYGYMCCLTGLPIQECLVASHIIPWSVNENLRADPTNGLCLSATYDRLFDRGLIAISKEFTIIASKKIMRSTNPIIRDEIVIKHGNHVILPARFLPNTDYLRWHFENVFIDNR